MRDRCGSSYSSVPCTANAPFTSHCVRYIAVRHVRIMRRGLYDRGQLVAIRLRAPTGLWVATPPVVRVGREELKQRKGEGRPHTAICHACPFLKSGACAHSARGYREPANSRQRSQKAGEGGTPIGDLPRHPDGKTCVSVVTVGASFLSS